MISKRLHLHVHFTWTAFALLLWGFAMFMCPHPLIGTIGIFFITVVIIGSVEEIDNRESQQQPPSGTNRD